MEGSARRRGPAIAGDGVQVVRRPGGRGRAGLLALALGLVVAAAGVLLIERLPEIRAGRDALTERPGARTSAEPRSEAGGSAANPSEPATRPGLPPLAVAPRPAATSAPPAEMPSPEELRRRLRQALEQGTITPRQAGEKSGIGAFPPPGTDPVKPGIMVPESFSLPPGYVRHYQTTDDGLRLPPILMFQPGYEWQDASGSRVPLPADRVVPPGMAPPGMPIEILQVPRTRVPVIEPRPRGGASATTP